MRCHNVFQEKNISTRLWGDRPSEPSGQKTGLGLLLPGARAGTPEKGRSRGKGKGTGQEANAVIVGLKWPRTVGWNQDRCLAVPARPPILTWWSGKRIRLDYWIVSYWFKMINSCWKYLLSWERVSFRKRKFRTRKWKRRYKTSNPSGIPPRLLVWILISLLPEVLT